MNIKGNSEMRMPTIIKKLFQNISGSMAIETAMLMPVFLTMTLSALGYGYVIYTKQELYFVSDEVAREIYLKPDLTTSEIVASVKAKLVTNINLEKLTVSSVSSTIGTYEYRTISISYIMPIVLFGYNNNEININFDKKIMISG
jgi:Flp pilus assembly protein TadG